MTAAPAIWPGADGNPVSCREKLKTLAENHREAAQVRQQCQIGPRTLLQLGPGEHMPARHDQHIGQARKACARQVRPGACWQAGTAPICGHTAPTQHGGRQWLAHVRQGLQGVEQVERAGHHAQGMTRAQQELDAQFGRAGIHCRHLGIERPHTASGFAPNLAGIA